VTDTSSPTGHEDNLHAEPRADGGPPRALVLGGTGYIGGRLVPRLLAAGYDVRVLAREAARVKTFEWADRVETVVGDVTDAATVAEAVRDVDVLYYLVHSMAAGRDFEDADRRAARNIADKAAAASVSRIVYLGGLHPDGARVSEPGVRGGAPEGSGVSEPGVWGGAPEGTPVVGPGGPRRLRRRADAGRRPIACQRGGHALTLCGGR
jgi:hypothetical protein